MELFHKKNEFREHPFTKYFVFFILRGVGYFFFILRTAGWFYFKKVGWVFFYFMEFFFYFKEGRVVFYFKEGRVGILKYLNSPKFLSMIKIRPKIGFRLKLGVFTRNSENK